MSDDPIVELMARLLYGDSTEFPYDRMPETTHQNHERAARKFLAALSERGLKVLPVEATDAMTAFSCDEHTGPCSRKLGTAGVWRAMAAAFDPSQLEAKNGHQE